MQQAYPQTMQPNMQYPMSPTMPQAMAPNGVNATYAAPAGGMLSNQATPSYGAQ